MRRGFARYQCKCKVGWAGDGKVCGLDSDLDGWSDYALRCGGPRCKAVSKFLSEKLLINKTLCILFIG